MDREHYILEAKKITAYLLSKTPTELEEDTYVKAMISLNLELSDYDHKLWRAMLQSTWKMGCIDAGLALKDPGNMVRRKLFTMLAILETSPVRTSFFLSRDFSFFYYLKIAFVGFKAMCRAVIGILIIRKIRATCH